MYQLFLRYCTYVILKNAMWPDMVEHAFNPSTREAEAGGFRVRGQPGLQSELQDSQSYKEKSCLEKQTNKQTKQKKTDLPHRECYMKTRTTQRNPGLKNKQLGGGGARL
jgi:hypothetical protein